MSTEALVEHVQDQRSKLLNVLGAVQCMKMAVRHRERPPELEGAVVLLEEELQRIIDELDPIQLDRRFREHPKEGRGQDS
jgi:hypothetical protein